MIRLNLLTGWSKGTFIHTASPRIALLSRRMIVLIGLILAMTQGLIYCFLIPPWQHYDEPTHFEYAWLIANLRRLPMEGDQDRHMRREIAASMIEHDFYWNLSKPDLVTGEGQVPIGISELVHPPAYYLLVSLPLIVARDFDVLTQLYVARCVSVILFVLTIGITFGIMAELVPARHPLFWSTPLVLMLLPPFADIMSAVSNDVGAIFVFSLFLWVSIRTIKYGLAWHRAALVLGIAALATATKNTASVALVLSPLVFILALRSQLPAPRAWHGAVALLLLALLTVGTFSLGDAQYWYRGSPEYVQEASTRLAMPQAPQGKHVLQLTAPPTPTTAHMINPLLERDSRKVLGHTVTIGGWLWANQPDAIAILSLGTNLPASQNQELRSQDIKLTTQPIFYAWTASVPVRADQLRYQLSVTQSGKQEIQVYLDGAVLVDGAHNPKVAPTFDNANADSGTWDGIRFGNLVRNPSIEHMWPRLQPWVDHALVNYTRRSPIMVLSALFDLQRTSRILLVSVPSRILFTFFAVFGWGHVSLPQMPFAWIFKLMVFICGIGCCFGLWRRSKSQSKSNAMLAFLTVSGVIVWANAVLRVLPVLDGNLYNTAVARYGFPAVIPALLYLCGGWWSIWPPRLRMAGIVSFVAMFATLNVLAIWTIIRFYQSIPTL